MQSFAQHKYMLWTEVGAEGKIIKKLKWSAAVNTRIGSAGAETIFPQAGVEYKITKWMRASLEYRFILDKNKYDNYKSMNRLNLNVLLKDNKKRLSYSVRLRYQYAFNRINLDAYDADFDQAIRVKPSFEYDLNNSFITPIISTELFYSPMYSALTPGFTKIRTAVGVKFELDGPHGIDIKYQFDKKFRNHSADMVHALCLSYTFKF